MKKIKYFILIGVMAIGTTSYSQTMSKDEMIKKIFEVLKNKDEEGFIKLSPDAATIKTYMRTLIDTDTSKELSVVVKTYLDEITDSSLRLHLRWNFSKFIKRGEEKGVDWSHSAFISYKADSTMVDEEGIKIAKLTGTIYFNTDKNEYFLKFDNVTWYANKGWYGVEIRRIDEKNNENKEDEDLLALMAIADSVHLADSLAKATYDKSVQKPKPPVKNKPVKSKKQTPVRKPD